MQQLLDHTPVCLTVHDEEGKPQTYRQIIEQGLIQRGFTSKAFSHEKEPDNRMADSLLLTFDRPVPGISEVPTIRISVDFYSGEIVINISQSRRPPGACVTSNSGKVRFKQQYGNQLNPSVIFDYVDNIIQIKNPYLFTIRDVKVREGRY